jgi:hypothetical protein
VGVEKEPPESRSVLGLPVRLVLAVASIALPLLSVAWFNATHDWPPAPSCYFAVLWCPSASPLGVQTVDWLDTVGPVLGLGSALGALLLRKEPGEAGILVLRYALPVSGLFVVVGCAIQIWSWLAG